jgi:hypothetical protein
LTILNDIGKYIKGFRMATERWGDNSILKGGMNDGTEKTIPDYGIDSLLGAHGRSLAL